MPVRSTRSGPNRPAGRATGSGARGATLEPALKDDNDEDITGSRKAWHECLAEIRAKGLELCDLSTGYNEVWYRGQPRLSFDLMPSLFRRYPDPNSDAGWTHIWHLEQDLYWEFAARARELHGVVDEDWDILFAMQHYGVPTRLLDWTETLAVGVFFALHGFRGLPGDPIAVDPKDPPCIWLLNPYELNVWSIGKGKPRDLFDPKNLGWDEKLREYFGYSDLFLEGALDWDYPIAVFPRQRTTRMQVQRGWFTIHGDEYVPLCSLKKSDRFLRRVVITAEAERGAREFLHNAGIELFTLFPDLPNLAASLSRHASESREEYINQREARQP